MSNSSLYKNKNIFLDKDMINEARLLKYSIASKIKFLTNDNEITTICLAYITTKVFSKYNAPHSVKIKEATSEIVDKDISAFLNNYLTQEIWDAAKDVCLGASVVLLSIVPFLSDEYNYRYANNSTPESIRNLAIELLEIDNDDNVGDFGCGKGDFIISAFLNNPDCHYYGVDYNTECVYIAKIRFDILAEYSKVSNVIVEQNNIFDLKHKDRRFSKIFSDFPFGLKNKNSTMEDFVLKYQDTGITKWSSSEWLYSLAICEHLEDYGKATVVMSNGALFRYGSDSLIRKNFINKGKIIAAIALPANMFEYTSIPTTMLILGNNTSGFIRVVDASECYERERRFNYLSKDNIAFILNSIKEDTSISKMVSYEELAENDYVLTPKRYLRDDISFKDGVEFSTVIKNITRGAGISASELDKIISKDETDYQYVMLSNIKGGIIDSDLPYITHIPEQYTRYCINNNNLLLSKNGAPYKVAVATIDKGKQILANGNLFVIEIDEEKVNPHYLKAFFNSQEGNKVLSSLSTPGTIPNLSVKDLKNVKIPIPSLEKQNEIANKFLQLEDEIKILEIRIAKCREKLIGIFNNEEDN